MASEGSSRITSGIQLAVGCIFARIGHDISPKWAISGIWEESWKWICESESDAESEFESEIVFGPRVIRAMQAPNLVSRILNQRTNVICEFVDRESSIYANRGDKSSNLQGVCTNFVGSL